MTRKPAHTIPEIFELMDEADAIIANDLEKNDFYRTVQALREAVELLEQFNLGAAWNIKDELDEEYKAFRKKWGLS